MFNYKRILGLVAVIALAVVMGAGVWLVRRGSTAVGAETELFVVDGTNASMYLLTKAGTYSGGIFTEDNNASTLWVGGFNSAGLALSNVDLRIPETIGGKTVKYILSLSGDYPGYNGFYENTNVLRLTLPWTCELYSNSAFAKSQIEYVEFLSSPNPVDMSDTVNFSIGAGSNTSVYNETDIQTGIINNGAFGYNTKLETIKIGNTIKRIHSGGFSSTSTPNETIPVKNLILGENLVHIDDSAFGTVPALEKLHIPANVRVIGDGAFSTVANLRELIFEPSPTGQLSIINGSFNYAKVKNLILPGHLYKACSGAFGNGTFENIIFLDGNVRNTWIGSSGFYNSTAKSIIIGNTVQTICDGFFSASSSYPIGTLQYVEIGENVTEIRDGAFQNQPITHVYFRDNESGTVPDMSIHSAAFENCLFLKNVRFGNTVRVMGQNAFAVNNAFKNVYLPWKYIYLPSTLTLLTDDDDNNPATPEIVTAMKNRTLARWYIDGTTDPSEDFRDLIEYKEHIGEIPSAEIRALIELYNDLLGENIENLDEFHAALTKYLEDKEAYIAELIETHEEAVRELEAEIAALTEEKEQLESDKATLEADKAQLESDKATLAAEKAALESDKAGLEAEIAGLEEQLAGLGENDPVRAQLQAQIDEKNGAIAALEGQITAKNATIAELEGQIAAKNDEISALEGQITAKNGEIAELNGEIERAAEILECAVGEIHDRIEFIVAELKRLSENGGPIIETVVVEVEVEKIVKEKPSPVMPIVGGVLMVIGLGALGGAGTMFFLQRKRQKSTK